MGSESARPNQTLVTEVACPRCDSRVEVSMPDRDAEPTVSPTVAAFGDHTVVHCPAEHKFWVYFC
ncbi:hypothetical protein [Natrinema gelatinilyticum]|uniref:hypothetical protein n=1 Tax=Natrinema gelatinilyticum TaxID=2961571 RepID=UPI0020C402FB|nr:hypothetical protein [Natrinema gelatinilyticum]